METIAPHSQGDALLRRAEVERKIGLGRSAVYARMDPRHPQYDPTFPKPIAVSGPVNHPTAVRWVESEVEAWISAKITASRTTQEHQR